MSVPYRYMLDTNMVSHLIKGTPSVLKRLARCDIAHVCISAITHGELMFGLAKRPEAKRLHLAVHELLLRVDVLAWDSAVANRYGVVRAALSSQGRVLAPLDLRIAAHALSLDLILVTNDQAFWQLDGLKVEDWVV